MDATMMYFNYPDTDMTKRVVPARGLPSVWVI